jgi:hypothetical protein
MSDYRHQSTSPVGEWALRLVAIAGLGLLVMLSTKLVMNVAHAAPPAARSAFP